MPALSAAVYGNRGRAALFDGRPDEALRHLLPIAEPGHEAAHPTFALLTAADTVEAAVQVGRFDVAASRAATVRAWAERTGAGWSRRVGHRLHALIGDASSAEASFRAARDDPTAGEDLLDQARTRLLYGEWLRRARRRADARVELDAAATTLRHLGAAPLLARAQRELALAEPAGARRGPGPGAGLTAQELRVARLAAQGLTNREIAAQLLISARTVGHHLAGVYPKLGVTSRTELSRVDLDGDLRLRAAEPDG